MAIDLGSLTANKPGSILSSFTSIFRLTNLLGLFLRLPYENK